MGGVRFRGRDRVKVMTKFWKGLCDCFLGPVLTFSNHVIKKWPKSTRGLIGRRHLK